MSGGSLVGRVQIAEWIEPPRSAACCVWCRSAVQLGRRPTAGCVQFGCRGVDSGCRILGRAHTHIVHMVRRQGLALGYCTSTHRGVLFVPGAVAGGPRPQRPNRATQDTRSGRHDVRCMGAVAAWSYLLVVLTRALCTTRRSARTQPRTDDIQ